DAQDRGHGLCQKLAAFLERAGARLGDPQTAAAFHDELTELWRLDASAVDALVDFLEEQRLATGGPLPRTDRLLVERAGGRLGEAGLGQLIIHTYWGGTVNRPLAMAIQAAWDELHPDPVEIFHDDTCLLARVGEDVSAADLFALVPPEHIEDLLRRKLEATGFFGARFRWAAGTSLLLPRASFRQRLPLWLSRQKAKKLLDSVREFGDFPVVQEAWRTCLRDEFDLDTLKRLVSRVRAGELPFEEVRTDKPSPLASGLVWQYTNQYMYETDAPGPGATGSALRQDVLQELVHASHLRPRLPAALGERLRRKVQRLDPGYAPSAGDELALWLEERVFVPETEWHELIEAVARDRDEVETAAEVVTSVAEQALWVRLPDATLRAVASVDALARWLVATGDAVDELSPMPLAGDGTAARERLERLLDRHRATDPEIESIGATELVGEWLRFVGPIPTRQLAAVFGLDDDRVADTLDPLVEARVVVVDTLTAGIEALEVCDAENLEILLRWLRTDQRPSFEARPATELPLFLALHQGVADPGEGLEELQDRLEQLFGLALPAGLWEQEVLPARLTPYYPSWLDSAMQQSELLWTGAGREKIVFGFDSDRELFEDPSSDDEDRPADEQGTLDELFPKGEGRHEVHELAARLGRDIGSVNDQLWELAWAGQVSCDAWLAVRQGLQNRFQPIAATARSGRRPRRPGRFGGRRRGWQASRSSGGRWFALDSRANELDAMEREELVKDRVRLLLGRYGVLFRQLLQRELPAFAWSRVFRTLRLMELSGEIVAGQFFTGTRGLQFATHGALKRLTRGLPHDRIYWLCAADPASPCGTGVEGLGALPSRLPTTHLVYHGTRLVLVGKRRGKEIELGVAADHPRIDEYLAPLDHLLTREVQPLSSIPVETIDGEPAASSALASRLDARFRVTREGDVLRLWKRY
ncbi:MAG: ATP-dependent helicase, partial [Acidobacteriota bacterium]